MSTIAERRVKCTVAVMAPRHQAARSAFENNGSNRVGIQQQRSLATIDHRFVLIHDFARPRWPDDGALLEKLASTETDNWRIPKPR